MSSTPTSWTRRRIIDWVRRLNISSLSNVGTKLEVADALEELLPDTDNKPEMRLHIFAQHVARIMQSKPNDIWTAHPCDGVAAKVVVLPNRTVAINGVSCGNCHGAVKQFTNMVAKVAPTVVFDITGEDHEVPACE